MDRIETVVRSFFPKDITSEVQELYMSSAIYNFAVAGISVFEAVYLYTLGYDIPQIMMFFVVVYAVHFILSPFGAKLAVRFGYEKIMAFGSLFMVFYFATLFAIPNIPALFFVASILYGLQKSFYWPAFHADFARFSEKQERGKEISGGKALNMIAWVLGPLIGGFVANQVGFGWLFAGISILVLLSNWPTLRTKEKVNGSSHSFWHMYAAGLKKGYRKIFFGCIGFGEELIVFTIWPIFIFTVVGDTFKLGALIAIASLVTTITLLWAGKYVDRFGQRKLLKAGTISSVVVWVLRLLATSGLHVFALDTMSRMAKQAVMVPVTTLTYNRASKKKIMEQVLLFEMSLSAGKIVACLLVILIFAFSPSFSAAFILAGFLTFLYMLI